MSKISLRYAAAMKLIYVAIKSIRILSNCFCVTYISKKLNFVLVIKFLAVAYEIDSRVCVAYFTRKIHTLLLNIIDFKKLS